MTEQSTFCVRCRHSLRYHSEDGSCEVADCHGVDRTDSTSFAIYEASLHYRNGQR